MEEAVLLRNEPGVAALREAENRVQVGLVVSDSAFAGEECVNHGEDSVGLGERGVGVTSARGKGLATQKITRRQKLLGDGQPGQRFSPGGRRRREEWVHHFWCGVSGREKIKSFA